jgi:hypothetical protein
MAEIVIEPSSTSVECVSKFSQIMQGLVTSVVTSIDQTNEMEEGYANRSRRDFQIGVGDATTTTCTIFH